MSHHYKALTMIIAAGSLAALTGCIIDPNYQNGSYDPSAGSNYQPNRGGTSHNAASGASEYDRGCNDAKRGYYDQERHTQAYKDGHRACEAGGNQGGAQHQGGLAAAKKACTFQFGKSGHVQKVSSLKPGFWEIIVADSSGRKAACTANAQGTVSDWYEM